MTPKERKVVFTLIGVMFLIMVTVIVTKSAKKGKANAETQEKQNVEMQNMSSFMQGAIENNVDDVSVENTITNNQEDQNSADVQQTNPATTTVRYDSILFTNLKYENNNVGNKITVDITNTGEADSLAKVAKLILTKSTGEQIQCMITIPTLNVGETKQLEHLLDEDVSNIISFTVEGI